MGFNLGRKIRRSAKKSFGKKSGRSIVKFGKKLGRTLDEGERKFANTIDEATPFAAIAADAFIPGSGDAIRKGNDGLQSLHRSSRKLINQAPKIGASRGDKNKAVVAFGDNVNAVKKDYNRSKAILKDSRSTFQKRIANRR